MRLDRKCQIGLTGNSSAYDIRSHWVLIYEMLNQYIPVSSEMHDHP